jgi:periplasmic protein TonB
VDARFEAPATEASHSAGSAPEALPTSFTFGGNAVEKPAGSKKVLLGIVAVVLLSVVAYFAWPYVSEMIGGNHSDPASTPDPVSHPATTRPAPAMSAPAPAPSRPVAPAAAQPKPSLPSAAQNNPQNDLELDSVPDSASTPAHKSSAPAGKSAAKPDAAAAKPEVAPLVVKGGKVPATSAKPSAPDAPAPSVIGIASPASAPPLDLSSSAGAPRPVLQRVDISQGVSQGLLIKKIAPEYPREALTLRIEGTVQLLATISKTGDITDVKVLTGDANLSAAARDAVKRWKYKPYLLNGEPVEIQTPITVNFKLPQ